MIPTPVIFIPSTSHYSLPSNSERQAQRYPRLVLAAVTRTRPACLQEHARLPLDYLPKPSAALFRMTSLQTKNRMMPSSTSKIAMTTVRPTFSRKAVTCKAQQVSSWQQKLATAGTAAMLSLSALSGAPALAGEFDVLGEPAPTSNYFVDDANVLSKSTRGELNKKLKTLEITTGYRVDVVTVRKLEFETDAFAFADKVMENWHPEDADNKGIVLVVTAAKEGAVTGGAKFQEAVGEDLADSIITDNIPIYTEQEKYNQTALSAVERIEAKLLGQPVPDAPKREEVVRERTYKTKAETDDKKSVYSTVVLSLLFIAVVVPMLQFYGYTARD